MDVKFGSEIIQSYKRLSYTAWYALAEFVDNSTEAYTRNEQELKPILEAEGQNLTVKIIYDNNLEQIIISDNSIGMSKDDLETALVVGKKPNYDKGRSRYGLGMKTAACWLGNKWHIRTKRFGETVEHNATVDVAAIAKANTDVNYKAIPDIDAEAHYTIITIENLNRGLGGRTKGKVKDFLRSMYRKDFENYGLEIYWQNELLEWNTQTMITDKLYRNRDGELKRKDFSFTIGEDENLKNVSGWVGVFEKGSRRDAGFSIIQCNRVIKGWPDSYRPETLYGEGGRNDLVNQRLVGEIILDDFAVSHTKDEIIFLNNEQEELESILLEKCMDYKNFALEYRKYLDDERTPTADDSTRALNEFEKEIKSFEFQDKIMTMVVPEKSLIQKMKLNLVQAVTARTMASLKANVDGLEIQIYLDSQMSPNDPYVLIESTQSDKRVIIIVNEVHPHWMYLKGPDSILNFIRHCTYDGVSEWKAHFKVGRIDPDTIKLIKDGLLRVPLEIEQHET